MRSSYILAASCGQFLYLFLPSFLSTTKMFSSTFLSLLLIAASATNASPIHRGLGSPILSFASKIGALGNKTLVEIDRARATALIHNAQMNTSGKRSEYVPVSNTGVRFTTKVDVGSPPTQCVLHIFSPQKLFDQCRCRYTPHRYREFQHLDWC